MITIHCDGSIFPNPGGPMGWAFVAVDHWGEISEYHGGVPAAPGNTNNVAEMLALKHALEWLEGREAEIHSDSDYVVKGMNVWSFGWVRKEWIKHVDGEPRPVPNAALWQQLLKIRHPTQKILWVRGHNGTHGNERADKLAEAGRLSVTEPS